MSKYVIKNCPTYDYDEEFDYHICKQPLVPYECSVDNCKDCTDCLLKQIVDLCKHYKKHSDCDRDCPSFGMFLSKLLSKLDIQEVGNE